MSESAEAVAPPGSGDGGPPPEAQAEVPSVETSRGEVSTEGTEGNAEAAPAEPELVELDIWGEKIAIPKGQVPDEVLSKLDEIAKGTQRKYTQETQRIAETAKALEAEKEVVQRLGSLRNEALTEYSKGLALRSEIEQLSRVDVRALWQSNPDQARQVSDLLAQKQAEFQQTVSKVSEYETRAAAEEQQHVARLAEDGRQKVARAIKGFDEAKLIEYATKNGVPESAARTWPLNPPAAVMAWKAMMYDQLQAKAAPTAKPPAPPANPIKPVQGKSSSSAERDIASMSMSEYADYMNRMERQGRKSR